MLNKPKLIERGCKKHGDTTHILEGRGYYRCKKCRVGAVTRRRQKVKQKAVDYKGGKCEKCDYNKCVAALEFHHKDPNEKDFSISKNGACTSWEKVKAEVDKCMLVCSNCHREIHNAQIS
tara:strand:- start:1080 stop:1439 length:360 start_codon:yes stop_codon:yes gene_type:complete